MAKKNKIGLSEMIQNLRAELELAQRKQKGSNIHFEVGEVELELAVEVSRAASGEGKIGFWLVEFGGDYAREKSTSHTFKLKLTPKSASGGSIEVADEASNDKPIQ